MSPMRERNIASTTKRTARAFRSSACTPRAPTGANTATSSATPTSPRISASSRSICRGTANQFRQANFYKEEEEYALTSKFYSEFIMAFCEALELDKPIIMGSSMGGNICLPLALNYENELTALIAIEACDHSPGWWIDPLHHPHIHGGEVCATSVLRSDGAAKPRRVSLGDVVVLRAGRSGRLQGRPALLQRRPRFPRPVPQDFRPHPDRS